MPKSDKHLISNNNIPESDTKLMGMKEMIANSRGSSFFDKFTL